MLIVISLGKLLVESERKLRMNAEKEADGRGNGPEGKSGADKELSWTGLEIFY
jgi:hypothetical protein